MSKSTSQKKIDPESKEQDITAVNSVLNITKQGIWGREQRPFWPDHNRSLKRGRSGIDMDSSFPRHFPSLLLRFLIAFFLSFHWYRIIFDSYFHEQKRHSTVSTDTTMFICFLTMTNICLLQFCSFFLSWSNGMTADIGSLAAGLDGHVVRLGIWCCSFLGQPINAVASLD
jgi:hypothetical protein